MRDMVLFALRDEAPGIVDGHANVFTVGVGKVQSAINTMRLLLKHNPKRVINLGTAGGITLDPGIWRVNRVLQHDVDLRPLGIPPGHHLSDPHPVLSLGGQGHTCGSGDVFVTKPGSIRMPVDMVEMEAYSIARAAITLGIDVEVWKYISDGADDNGAADWQARVSHGESLYMETLDYLGVELERAA